MTTETADGRKSYRAKAVVLADGGFESNKDMLRRFITPHPENLHMRAPNPAMATACGWRKTRAAC